MKSVFALSLFAASFAFANDACCKTQEEEELAKKVVKQLEAETSEEIAQEEAVVAQE